MLPKYMYTFALVKTRASTVRIILFIATIKMHQVSQTHDFWLAVRVSGPKSSIQGSKVDDRALSFTASKSSEIYMKQTQA